MVKNYIVGRAEGEDPSGIKRRMHSTGQAGDSRLRSGEPLGCELRAERLRRAREGGGQKTGDRRRVPEIRSQRSEDGRRMVEEDGREKRGDRRQTAEDRRQMTEDGGQTL
jgi:hypothetical protein